MLALQEGEFAACFSVIVMMVHLPKPTVGTDDSNMFHVELAYGESIRFGNL
jgi:hypothetical protein